MRCLRPTDFYTEGQSYRYLCITPLVALLLCGEWANYLGRLGFPQPYIYIIPQTLRFVKGFLKNFLKNFSGKLHTYYIHGRLSVFMLNGWFLSIVAPSPLDIYIIPHCGRKVNRQVAQTFKQKFVQPAQIP